MAAFIKYRKRSWLRYALYTLLGLLALPYLLTLVYAVVPPPVTTMMLWKRLDGNAIDYRWRPLADTSQNLVRSVVTAEDARFCEHGGVDWETLKALATEVLEKDEGPSRGGSTITPRKGQQDAGVLIPKELIIDPFDRFFSFAGQACFAPWSG